MNMRASQEQQVASQTLQIFAYHITPVSERFSNWVLTATGAAVALLLSKLDTLIEIVSTPAIKWGIISLLASMLVGVLVRYNANSIETALKVEQEAIKLLHRISEERVELEKKGQKFPAFDIDVFRAEMHRSLLQPSLWLAERSHRLALAGDHVAPMRMLAKLSQINGRLIFAQFLLIALGPFLIVLGVKG